MSPKPTLDTLTREVFADLTPNTKVAFERAWARFRGVSSVASVEDFAALTPLRLERHLEELGKKFAPATVAQVLATIRFVVKRALRRELVARDFTVGVKVHVGDNVPSWNVLQPGELEKLAATEDLKLGTMERAVVLALALQGMRVSELCAAKWGDVVLQGRGELPMASASPSTPAPALKHQLKVVKGKGGKYATMGVQKLVMEAALAWAGERTKPEDYFIGWRTGEPLHRLSVTAIVGRLTKRHLGHRVTAHGLRATFVSDVISRRGIEVARQLARHSSMDTTTRYSRWTVTEDDEKVL